jgi:multiple sugar transport system permease protein
MAAAHSRPQRSMKADRRKALVWSYFFLGLFVVFFLTPPVYMLITSLKTNAEISAATSSPWWIAAPTLDNYVELLTTSTYLTFFRNSAMVSLLVVAITMLVSVPAAFALAHEIWGSTTPATGVFLTYLIPETLLFIPLFKIFVTFTDLTGTELINKWYAGKRLTDCHGAFATWIMIITSPASKELDEAAPSTAPATGRCFKIFIPWRCPASSRRPSSPSPSLGAVLYPLAFTTSATSWCFRWASSPPSSAATCSPGARSDLRLLGARRLCDLRLSHGLLHRRPDRRRNEGLGTG